MQGFIQDFKFGGNLNKLVDVEDMHKYAPTRGAGVWGHAPPQKFLESKYFEIESGTFWRYFTHFKMPHPHWGSRDVTRIWKGRGRNQHKAPKLLLVGAMPPN